MGSGAAGKMSVIDITTTCPYNQLASPNRMSKSFLYYPARLLLHFFVAATGGIIVGLIPEALVGRLFRSTPLEPLAPGMALTALLIGYFFGHRLVARFHIAQWTWIIGTVWFFCGVYELTRFWSPAWSHEKSAWDYAKGQLFGPNRVCGASECLYQLFFTVPFVLSLTYSIGAFVRARHDARNSTVVG